MTWLSVADNSFLIKHRALYRDVDSEANYVNGTVVVLHGQGFIYYRVGAVQ
jgi:hypothetical protein